MTSAWSTGIQHHPVRKEFQCKHIPEAMMIQAILQTYGGDYKKYAPDAWRMRWDVEKRLRELLGEKAPIGLAKVMMAKFNKMERRGILHGCSCGCRGDYHLPKLENMCC